MTTDKFVKGTNEFDNIYNTLFNNYFPTFELECLDYSRYVEHYKVNNHRITCHIFNDEIQEIIVERHYYYYNK